MVATLFIFLNARVAFWVAAGIPVAMFATLGFMLLMGQTVNMITLFAMIMMLGVIVDDAIVVGEHTAARFAAGEGAFEAAENGAGRMLTPVMAAMLTTAAAFGPMLLIRDVIGQIMGVMPYVVFAVIIASLVECFLILPGHLAHTLEHKPKRSWSFLRQDHCCSMCRWAACDHAHRTPEGSPELPGLSFLAPFFEARSEFEPVMFLLLITLGALLTGTLFEALFWLLRRIAPGKRAPGEEGWFRQWFDRNFNAFGMARLTGW